MNEKKDIITLEFGAVNMPQPYESKNTSDTTYVSWGLNNQYPAWLIDLYNQSSVHNAIINQKANYIIGGGLKSKDNKDINVQVNPSDSIQEFTNKVILDYLIFGALAVEVNFNVFGEPIEYHHIPYHRLRMNKPKTQFWYNEDWFRSRINVKYDRYSVAQNQDGKSKIFLFDGYFPTVNLVYPTPEYVGSLKSILTDISIKEFNLNNLKNHFSPSTIITFFNGSNVNEQVKQQVIDEIDNKFKGESGKKFIIDFQHKDGKSAEVKQLSANDWDKAYTAVADANLNDIMIGHQVQNPSLFGIKTAGQLGSSQELEVSYEIFKNNYISVKRAEIESALNQLFSKFPAINGKLMFADKQLFNERLPDSVKEKIYTINELRKIAGLEAIANGDRLLSEQPVAAPVQNEAVPDEDVKKKIGYKLTEEDYERIKDLGVSSDEFDVVEEMDEHQTLQFDKESDISQYILDNDMKGLKIDELVKVLKTEGKITTTLTEVDNILNKMKDAGLINIDTDKDGRLSIKPLPKPEVPDTGKISTMYKYIKKPEATGGDLIPTSRSFCVKLIENNRLYTREDIQSMTSLFGYDIFKHAGGWWYDPIEDKTNSSCRHMWKAVKVKPKNNQ